MPSDAITSPTDSITLPIGEYYARLDTPAGPDPLALPGPDWAQWQPSLDLPTRHGLRELQQRIQQDDQDKWDLTVPRDRLALAQGQLVLPEEHLDEHPELLTLSPWATAQACQRLGIPAPTSSAAPLPCKTLSSTTGPGAPELSRTTRRRANRALPARGSCAAREKACGPSCRTGTLRSTIQTCWEPWFLCWKTASRCGDCP